MEDRNAVWGGNDCHKLPKSSGLFCKRALQKYGSFCKRDWRILETSHTTLSLPTSLLLSFAIALASALSLARSLSCVHALSRVRTLCFLLSLRNTHMHTHTHTVCIVRGEGQSVMGWLRLVGSSIYWSLLQKSPTKRDSYFAKETYIFMEPTNRCHPI